MGEDEGMPDRFGRKGDTKVDRWSRALERSRWTAFVDDGSPTSRMPTDPELPEFEFEEGRSEAAYPDTASPVRSVERHCLGVSGSLFTVVSTS